ncbi:MAG TPA: hypothetical protein VMT24_06150 [Aggregatilineaceae bacterium]|nr:hypothetical protein [Aggregatilineaceae bacterium]
MRSRVLPWLVAVLFALPAVVFFAILHAPVRLAPLSGWDGLCVKCDRKATRTLPGAAAALRAKGVYVYDKVKYPNGAPVWCDRHGPDPDSENAGPAYAAALGTLGVLVIAYKCIPAISGG